MHTFTLKLGGDDVLAAPLTFGAIKRSKDLLQRMETGGFSTVDELFEAMAAIVLEAVRRVDPTVTLAELTDLIGYDEAKEAIGVVLARSLPPAPLGEKTAGSPSGPSTGTP